MIDIPFSRNCVYQFANHVVWCLKYRKKILLDKIAFSAVYMIDEICKKNERTVVNDSP